MSPEHYKTVVELSEALMNKLLDEMSAFFDITLETIKLTKAQQESVSVTPLVEILGGLLGHAVNDVTQLEDGINIIAKQIKNKAHYYLKDRGIA